MLWVIIHFNVDIDANEDEVENSVTKSIMSYHDMKIT